MAPRWSPTTPASPRSARSKCSRPSRATSNWPVTLGFKNDSDATVRLINLTQTGALLVIDNDGYSNALVALANPDDVTVPAKAGIRQTFVFEGGAEGIKAVRLWGKDLPVK